MRIILYTLQVKS